ncbi:MAG: hypothetical protein JNM65_01460 [Verrucomicrobiaceae bacterium]|nr:hypothetical protein [Verrucomicrobiaceae bacterium]
MKILPILILVAAGSLRAEEPPKPTQTPAGAKAQMHVIPPGKRVRKAQTAADPAWIANGKDKLPKLQRVCGTTDNVRAVFYDAKGVKAAEIKDVFHQHTDVNKLLGTGDFTFEFYDKEGRLLKSTGELKQAVRLK